MCDEHPKFYRISEPIARLVHRCDECWRPIMRAEQYVAYSGKWDGEVSTYRAHELCHLLASQVSVDDGCRIYGALGEFIGEADNLTPLQVRWWESLSGKSLAAYREGEA